MDDHLRLVRGRVRKNEDELFATDPPENIRPADQSLQRDGEILQDHVAKSVAEAVVDVFEIVEVQHGKTSNRLRNTAMTAHQLVKLGHDEPPAGNPCQFVCL